MKLRLLSRNSKIKKSGSKVYNFGIPAQDTCIGATICKKYCYASKGAYTWPVVKAAYERRLAATKRDDFPEVIMDEIIMSQASHIRIHDAGDFYSREYLAKWLTVADALPHVKFYCYTKSIPLFEGQSLPENFTAIYSLGGRWDRLIDTSKHTHAKIFDGTIPRSYIDASQNDLMALTGKNIGLSMH